MSDPKVIEEAKRTAIDMIDKMGAKGYFVVGVVCYKTGVPNSDAVRVACPAEFYEQNQPAVVRLLENALTILKAGADDRVIEPL